MIFFCLAAVARPWGRAATLVGAALTLALGACGQPQPTTPSSAPMPPTTTAYDQMLRLLYKPTVPAIRPATLAASLRQAPTGVLLLDTRTPAEYRVSHLPGARFVDFDHYRQLDLGPIPRTQPVVVYCTVGARSEQVGAWLREQGFTNVHNLYGGIFQWVNEGQGVVNAQGPTANVHPYSVLWRPWLRKGTPAYE